MALNVLQQDFDHLIGYLNLGNRDERSVGV